RARRIKRARACKARDTDFPFDFRVIRLEIGISDRPVNERRAGGWADFATFYKIDFMEAPEIRGEVIARAADGTPVNESALRLGFLVRRLAEGVWLQLRMIGQKIFLQDF